MRRGVEKMEPKVTYYFKMVKCNTVGFWTEKRKISFTGRWKVKNKDLYVEVEYIVSRGLFGNHKEPTQEWVSSHRIEWDEEWPIQSCS